MPPRRLSPPERVVWGQVARTVTPIEGKTAPLREPDGIAAATAIQTLPQIAVKAPSPVVRTRKASVASPANTLDAGWDRRLAKGVVAPDYTIDLHGETLHSAHAKLDFALGDAVRQGARLLLLITGKAGRDNPRLPPTTRGVIRASIADWIGVSSYSSRIAAVRPAHPRHGGAGALYVIIKRARGG